MSDFSLTTVFVVPTSQTSLPTGIQTQALAPGQFGLFNNVYTAVTNVGTPPYFYVAQGRENTYLQSSKRSDKIKGCAAANCNSNVTEWYKVSGCGTPTVQITDVTDFNVHCGDVVTITLRAHSSYLDTLYFNGWTRSITVQAPCCDCGADPCDTVDTNALINQIIAKFNEQAPSTDPANITFSDFYEFTNVGGTTLRITGKPLTQYGQPCDIAAFPWEYDRMWFRTFVYSGPATTADFIVEDDCNIVANAEVIQRSSYPRGTSEEIAQLEKNFHSYQAGYGKALFRMNGYNNNFESYVTPGAVYDTFYIKFNEFDKSAYSWGDYIHEDSTVIIAVESGSDAATAIQAALVTGLGSVVDKAGECVTTTSTTTDAPPATTTTTTTLIP